MTPIGYPRRTRTQPFGALRLGKNKIAEKEALLDQVVNEISRSSSYKTIDKQVVRRIAEREFSKNKKAKEAIKSTKNKLHQIGGAFLASRPRYSSWLQELRSLRGSDDNRFRETCTRIMSLHSSTKERLEILNKFYQDIFSEIPRVNSVLDLACGLNPLSIPWIPQFERLEYCAYDIYADLVDFLNAFIELLSVKGHAEVRDVLFDPPKHKADLALILKTIPCFDRIDKTAVQAMLQQINVDSLVVSFPVASLGGTERMMIRNYTERFEKIARQMNWNIKKMLFKTELVFLVTK
jgi:16S rRNA (guanine(1405)-N(7))-methyltransferase